MFEKNDNKRKWSCFCCGKWHNDPTSFKDHIVEKHEEGRDYVLCPLCTYPVRDLNTHVKVKHKDRKIPKGYHGPLRAIIWKDQGKKGKKTRKPTFRQGHFVSIKNNGKEFFYRSGYECEVLECLELIPEVLTYDVEPLKNGIPYLFKGEPHTYYPDFSIKFSDGHIEIWEIKPATQTALPVNEAKWSAANTYCKTRGWEFIVITEVGIGKLKSKVRKQKK